MERQAAVGLEQQQLRGMGSVGGQPVSRCPALLLLLLQDC
jgi:hypothetical protein